jgi:hypothetical protein
MSTIAQSKRSKDADLRRGSSTGHDEARPIQHPGPQTNPRSSSFTLAAHHQSEHITRTCALDHRDRSLLIPSTAQRANLKSP